MESYLKQAALVSLAFMLCVYLRGDDVPRDGLRNGNRVSGPEYIARIGYVITKMFAALYSSFILMIFGLRLIKRALPPPEMIYLAGTLRRPGALIAPFFLAFGISYVLLGALQNLIRRTQKRPMLKFLNYP